MKKIRIKKELISRASFKRALEALDINSAIKEGDFFYIAEIKEENVLDIEAASTTPNWVLEGIEVI